MKNLTYTNWGINTFYKKKLLLPKNIGELKNINKFNKKGVIVSGNLRSFGDTCINKSKSISLKNFKKIILLDKKSSILEVSSNALLKDVLKEIIPQGFMIPVTPGSKYVTIGGMISNNIFGKNTKNNQFKFYIKNIKILTSKNKIVTCSNKVNKKLFNLTVGGFGLSGIILSAKLKVIKIHSQSIDQTIFKFTNIKKFMEISKKNYPFSVAWINSHSLNLKQFEGMFYLGKYSSKKAIPKLFKFDNKNINWFFKFFLELYIKNFNFSKLINYLFFNFKKKKQKINFDDFFYPQDKWLDFNKCYKKGFFQIQFLIPEKKFQILIKKISKFFDKYNIKSTFIIIKRIKEKGEYLNFYGTGYSISFDFEINNRYEIIKNFFNKIVSYYNLRVNLSKDIISKKEFLLKKHNFVKFKKDLISIDKNRIYKNEFSNRFKI